MWPAHLLRLVASIIWAFVAMMACAYHELDMAIPLLRDEIPLREFRAFVRGGMLSFFFWVIWLLYPLMPRATFRANFYSISLLMVDVFPAARTSFIWEHAAILAVCTFLVRNTDPACCLLLSAGLVVAFVYHVVPVFALMLI